MKKVYITTSIPYANAKPHVGFALELIQADVLARYYRQKGDEVFFLTGTDEHGYKIQQTATELHTDPKNFVDQIAESFRSLGENLNIKNNDFVRTTEARHKDAARELWRLCSKDIYKKSYRALYCRGCEEFKTERELVNGLCPNHKTTPEEVSEENYFFALSKYASKIKELIVGDQLKVTPESRKNEVLKWLDQGVEDISISRERGKFTWGIPVEDDPTQIFYVWIDALSNYLTGTGFPKPNFKNWWSDQNTIIHIIGKDILRFHAIIWPGLLLSAGLPLPKVIYVHGHITSENQKMSKSLGNVVDPLTVIKNLGADALRYFLLSKIPWDGDGDFSQEKFENVYRGELADNWGNLENRVFILAEKAGLSIPDYMNAAESFHDDFVENFKFNLFIERLMADFSEINRQINKEKPWELINSDPTRARKLIGDWLVKIFVNSRKLAIVLPTVFEKIEKSYKKGEPEQLFPRV